ncbi:MAG TPA: potassium channel family protein [Rhodothermales bacterium]|nr:potassium channel family protein [Rhodothermales bacterium]
MIFLAFIWLVLLVAEFIWGLSPLLQLTVQVIWVIFVLDFLIRFVIAPGKVRYLKRNWLTALSLFLPALRVLRVVRVVRVFRIARAARGLRLVKIVGSLNRGMRALGASMRRRGATYVIALTLVVWSVGAAGMYAFESNPAGGEGLRSYGEALWWTGMLLTTIGSEFWPKTPEGRILCLLLSLFSIGILGYITATLATFFIGRDAEDEGAEVAGQKSIDALRREVEGLNATVRRLVQQDNTRAE